MRQGQIPVLQPRYVSGIFGSKGAGHTNDWCIKMEFSARVLECLSTRTSTTVSFVSSTSQLLLQFIPSLKKNVAYVSWMSYIDLYVTWTFFIFQLMNCRQTDRQTDRQTHTHTKTDTHTHKRTYNSRVGAFLQEYIHANDLSYALYNWAMLLHIYVSLFAELHISFLQAVWTQIRLLMYNVGAFWYWSTLFVSILT